MAKEVGSSPLGSAPIPDLKAWADSTEQEIEELLAAIRPLEERMVAARERLDLIRRLVGLAAGGEPKAEGPSRPVASGAVGVSSALPQGADVEAHLEAILADAGEPLHIGVLRNALIDRGVPLPGKGEEANLIVRLRRDEGRFTRTGRGTYGLTVWGVAPVPASKSKKIRIRTKRS